MASLGHNELTTSITFYNSAKPKIAIFYSTKCTTLWQYIKLTPWGRATHICVGKLTIIGSDNGLSPGWRQAIIGTNAGILLHVIGAMGINFSEISIAIHTFSFRIMHLNMSSAKSCPFCLGLSVLRNLLFQCGLSGKNLMMQATWHSL